MGISALKAERGEAPPLSSFQILCLNPENLHDIEWEIRNRKREEI